MKFKEWVVVPPIAVKVGFVTPVGVPALWPPPPPPPLPPPQAAIVTPNASAMSAIAALKRRFFGLKPIRKKIIAAPKLKRNARAIGLS